MSVDIAQVIAAIPSWRGRQVTTEEIVGGLTNRNFRVEVDGQPCFVRIPGAETGLLVATSWPTAGPQPRLASALVSSTTYRTGT